MSTFGFVPVMGIAVICYLLGEGVKISPLDNKWIPLIVGICGGILGVVGLVTKMPEFATENVLNAVAIGIVSGLGATGFDQIGKQLGEK